MARLKDLGQNHMYKTKGYFSVLKEGYTRVNPWPCFESNKQWEIPLTGSGNDRKKFTGKDKISWRRFTVEYLIFHHAFPCICSKLIFPVESQWKIIKTGYLKVELPSV